jgi:beta-glucosidase-like glycosyl hydrolase
VYVHCQSGFECILRRETGLIESAAGNCVGNTKAVSSIGYPSLCLMDGPLGIRYAQGVTAWPAGIMAGATWDKDLIYARGQGIGAETHDLGVRKFSSPSKAKRPCNGESNC